ncbi:MAG: Ig-like domain-containing protein [Actinomycetota bacterium]|nr:Ig-like domain-containing protein [Actinomycetota bacterium]
MGRVDRRGVRYIVGLGLLVGLLGGCAQGGATDGAVRDAAQLGTASAAQPRLTVNPPDGAVGVSPAERVTAAVIGGQLTQVQLTAADGSALVGVLSPDGERWSSSIPLKPNTSYVLNAGSRSPSGEESSTTARFRTLAPGQEITGKITPDDSAPVPVTQSVSVLFDKPIANRVVVERAFRVTSNPAATGATEWRSDRELLWRPAPGWSPGSQVTVSLDIYGKQLGGGLVGAADLRTTFAVVGEDGLALRAPSSSSSVPSSTVRPPGSRPSTAPSVAARSATPPSSASRPSAAQRAALPAPSARSSTQSARSSTQPAAQRSSSSSTTP